MPILNKSVTISRPVSQDYHAYQCDGCGALNDISQERREELEKALQNLSARPLVTEGINLTGWSFLSAGPSNPAYVPMSSKVFCPDCTKKVHV